ncbi:MAG: glycosyltransferase [Acidobacteria bacterium]|nr:glycosyltransferase [Acidobacteriota bacterium]
MRIAFFSPLNPKPSGISDYSESLLPHLAARVERLDVFIEDYELSNNSIPENVRIRHWREFEPDYRTSCYDIVLYQIGNNPFHVYIYDLAVRIPGVLVLHEFNLHYLLAEATIVRQDWEGYFREVEYNAGVGALKRARRVRAGLQEPDYHGIAMNRRLIENNQGVIVHSDYMVDLLREGGFALPVRKIPHGVELPNVDGFLARRQVAELAQMPLGESTAVFGVFGFLKPYKRIEEALRAFARLHREHPNTRLILVGEEQPYYPLRPLIAKLGLQEAARLLGYVPLDTFITCMRACDVCLNLRRPTVGETSGTLLRALALGKPTMVSEIGAFRELPEDAAIKIPVDDREVDWLYEYMKVLLGEPELRRAIGEKAREYAAQECSWPLVADQYAGFLRQRIGLEIPRSSEEHSATSSAASAAESSSPSRPLEELEEYVIGFSHASPLVEDYALVHRKRLVHTLRIIPPGGPEDRVLELGCYLQLTPALRKYLGYGEVRGAYYGRSGQTHMPSATSITDEAFSCPVDLFDAERDRFPYPDAHFRTVLCCEVLEHLSTDPMHMMAEINRVLAPDGCLVLSTPNITGLRSVHAVLHGYHPGIFHSYIKPGEDGRVDPRHSREYAPREIAMLMEAAGFIVELLETGDYGRPESYFTWVQDMLQKIQCSLELRGEIIYCRARKTGPVRERWPKELYYPPES